MGGMQGFEPQNASYAHLTKNSSGHSGYSCRLPPMWPGFVATRWLSLLLVLYSARRGFSLGFPVFPSFQKPTYFQILLFLLIISYLILLLVNSSYRISIAYSLYLFLSFILGKQYRVNLQFSFSRCFVFFCCSLLNKCYVT